MEENNIHRRDMIRISSLAALSNILTPVLASSTVTSPKMQEFRFEKADDDSGICYMNAVTMASLLRSKKISAREVMQAHLNQIKKVNAKVNAIITLIPEEELMAQALAADESLAKGKLTGSLHGLPMAVKDLTETKGIRTTYGSPIWRNNIPLQDALLVQRQKQAGAIIIGKTNVPELGMGSQTFNPLFGPSYNPYDISKTCGGSTGGGAAALACGMIPLTDGSDMGGSLRNPGSFCNVVGLRTSPGRVPIINSKLAWQELSVQGPMARTVSDCALLLSVQAGPDNRSPFPSWKTRKYLSNLSGVILRM